jgi:hypothetical protein
MLAQFLGSFFSTFGVEFRLIHALAVSRSPSLDLSLAFTQLTIHMLFFSFGSRLAPSSLFGGCVCVCVCVCQNVCMYVCCYTFLFLFLLYSNPVI